MTTGLRERKAQSTNGKPTPRAVDRVADDLEPYRRLIEIQKQLAEMAKRNEQAQRECDALREEIARELTESLRSRSGLRQRLRSSAAKLLQRLPRILAAETASRTTNRKGIHKRNAG